jgi:proteasome accessory factor B
MRLAGEIASYGPDVVVEGPAAVRTAVVERLTRLAAMAPEGAA